MRRICVGGVVPAAATAVGVRVPALRLCSPSSSAEGRGRRCPGARASRVLEARALCRAEFVKNNGAARCLLAMVIGYRCATANEWPAREICQATRDILASYASKGVSYLSPPSSPPSGRIRKDRVLGAVSPTPSTRPGTDRRDQVQISQDLGDTMGNDGGGAHTSDHLPLRPDRIRRALDVRRRPGRHLDSLDRRLRCSRVFDDRQGTTSRRWRGAPDI